LNEAGATQTFTLLTATTTSPSFDILLLAGGWREHRTKRKHVYPVQITTFARLLLLLDSAHLLFIKEMAELGAGK
jgi:hypothetical protein